MQLTGTALVACAMFSVTPAFADMSSSSATSATPAPMIKCQHDGKETMMSAEDCTKQNGTVMPDVKPAE
jgi:hypothetical protein